MNEQINKLFGQALDEAVPETWTTLDADQLNRFKDKFAELIAAEEREACAKICDRFIGTTKVIQAERIQSAIRARGEK